MVSYWDGCNGCDCLDSGFVRCTLAYCSEDEYGDSYCTSCEDGYKLNDNKECVEGETDMSSTMIPEESTETPRNTCPDNCSRYVVFMRLYLRFCGDT